MPIDYSASGPTGHQRLPDYKRDDAWIKSFLRESLIGYVGHLSENQPFITPTNFWFDEENSRIVFHSNIIGRTRSNLEKQSLVCFVTSEYGKFLPSNAALEFSVQYRSVMVFGKVIILSDSQEKSFVLEKLIEKYFPDLRPDVEYRSITQKELERTSVYSIEIDSWSGKENWPDQAEQIPDWPSLPDKNR
jgi:nitroimidazol reductase NimA-like FMN-containing flavoprotein (pyridoxamine 5'-phosphate oxidase superfamily)